MTVIEPQLKATASHFLIHQHRRDGSICMLRQAGNAACQEKQHIALCSSSAMNHLHRTPLLRTQDSDAVTMRQLNCAICTAAIDNDDSSPRQAL